MLPYITQKSRNSILNIKLQIKDEFRTIPGLSPNQPNKIQTFWQYQKKRAKTFWWNQKVLLTRKREQR